MPLANSDLTVWTPEELAASYSRGDEWAPATQAWYDKVLAQRVNQLQHHVWIKVKFDTLFPYRVLLRAGAKHGI